MKYIKLATLTVLSALITNAQVIDSFESGAVAKLLTTGQTASITQSLFDVLGGQRTIDITSIGKVTQVQVNQQSARGSTYVYGSTSEGSTVAFSYSTAPLNLTGGSVKVGVAVVTKFGTPATVSITVSSGPNNVSTSYAVPITSVGTYSFPLAAFVAAPGKFPANFDEVTGVAIKTTLGNSVSSVKFSEFGF